MATKPRHLQEPGGGVLFCDNAQSLFLFKQWHDILAFFSMELLA